MNVLSGKTRERLLYLISPIALIALWQVLLMLGIGDRRFIPAPSDIAQRFVKLLASGELAWHVGVTLYRVSLGYVIGAVPAVAIGLLMAMFKPVRIFFDPLIAALFPIPKIALMPLLLLAFGFGDASKVALVAIAVFFPVIVNTYVGASNIDKIYWDVAKNYGASQMVMFTRVVFFGALPMIFAGLRIALAVSFIVLVASEFVATKSGIGYLIWNSWELLQVDIMFVGIVTIGILELVDAVTADALERAGARLDDIHTVAVTRGPGLIGALLVGLSSAKALAATRQLPLVPVDHLHGHAVASTLRPDPIEAPYLALVASGGHTFLARVDDPAEYSVLGQTLDDAAGEAFDKGARLLGLGYPGGPEIDRLAREGDPEAFAFPRSAPGELDFSFSGLKTSLLYVIRDLGEEAGSRAADLAASYQRAIVDALVERTRVAREREGLERLAIGGGVAANSELRAAVEGLDAAVWVPPVELCTDNAAMIAGAARFLEPVEYPHYLNLDAAARL